MTGKEQRSSGSPFAFECYEAHWNCEQMTFMEWCCGPWAIVNSVLFDDFGPFPERGLIQHRTIETEIVWRWLGFFGLHLHRERLHSTCTDNWA